MNKLTQFLTASSIAALLTACGSDAEKFNTSNSAAKGEDTANNPRVLFDPAAKVVPVPSDLLFSGTQDGTLELPDEIASRAALAVGAIDRIDLSSPTVAMGALDGWSVHGPIKVDISLGNDVAINDETLAGNVVLLEVNADPALSQNVNPASYSVFSTSDGIVLSLNTALKPGTQYAVALLEGIEDMEGRALLPSYMYNVLASDVEVGSSSLATVQGIIATTEALLAATQGIDESRIVFSSVFTTVSTGAEFAAIKQVMVGQALAAMESGEQPNTFNNIAVDPVATATTNYILVQSDLEETAIAYSATLSLPYYLADDQAGALSDSWQAACDNGALLSTLEPEEMAQLPTGENHALCSQLGLADFGLDTERYITKYNPMPATQSVQELEVTFVLPSDIGEESLPVVIALHGLTGSKSDMLALAPSLIPQGYAIVAIDAPLHGSRAFGLADASADPSVFINLASLLTARDNFRQAVADVLGLRLALNTLNDEQLPISDQEVYLSGIALGAIIGTGVVAHANLSTGNETIVSLYHIEAAGLNAPGGGLGGFVLESPAFADTIRGTIVKLAGNVLTDAFNGFVAQAQLTEQETAVQYQAFVAHLQADPEANAAVLAGLQELFIQFLTAGQAIVDAADPSAHAAFIKANPENYSIYLSEMVGGYNGELADLVIPNQTSELSAFGGTEALIRAMGLASVESRIHQGSGAVRFAAGTHSSSLNPAPESSMSATPELNRLVTAELQGQQVGFFNSGVIAVGAANPAQVDIVVPFLPQVQ